MNTWKLSPIAALLAAVLLLAGCGTASVPDSVSSERPGIAPPVTEAQETGDAAVQTSSVPERTVPDAVVPEVSTDLDSVAGLWALQELEVDGDRVSAELSGLSAELLLRVDGTADYVELGASGEVTVHPNLIVDGDGDGRLDFAFDGEFGRMNYVITAGENDALELSGEWTGPDGTAGGNTQFFRRETMDERGRKLYPAELEQLTASLDGRENGFFVCTYDRPEEIDWAEVCYNGAGIGAALQPEAQSAYLMKVGEIYGSLEAIHENDLADFVWNKTQTPYSSARHPLWASTKWTYLEDYGLWCFDHGDTNAQPISFTDGYANGSEYYLYYTRADAQTYFESREFVMHCYIRDGDWQYISNLPADAPAPVTLLSIEFFESRQDVQGARGTTSYLFVEERPSDEPNDWGWALVTAQTDQVRYILNRGDESVSYDLYGVFVPGENISSGVLNQGESFAVYVNQPWHPSVQLVANKDAFWGEYLFGEDNWLHFDNTVTRYVTGHDLQGEGRGCRPANEAQLARFLMDGDWLYMDEESGSYSAAVSFSDYRYMTISTEETAYPIYLRYGYENADPESEAPDKLTLEKDNSVFEADWSVLPYWYYTNALGDYLISAIQLDGEQLLYLTPLYDGGGDLRYLLPGGPDGPISLIRFRGMEVFEGQGGT